jgi:predicted DNA-binding transcriptional regulator AlpA
MARLTAPPPAQSQADELLSAPEAGRRLGISQDYLYRHHSDFPFTRRLGRRLLFSALGIEKYIRQHKCIDSNTAQKYIQPVGFPTGG